MKTSVLLFCASGLVLCLVIVGARPRTGEQREVSVSPAKTAAALSPLNQNPAGDSSWTRMTEGAVSGPDDLQRQILAALNSGDPGAPAGIFTHQLLALIKADPWAAARLAESPAAGEWRTELMRVTAQQWAAADPQEAAKWVAQLADANERDTMLGCVCFQVAETAPAQAVQILEQQEVGDDRRQAMLDNLVQQWAAQDEPAAAAWAANNPAGTGRDHLFLHLALAQAPSAPAAAAAMVAEEISPGPVQEQAAISVLQQWAWQDWEGALSWVKEFPAGEYRDRAICELTGIAAAKNSTAPPAGLQGSFQ